MAMSRGQDPAGDFDLARPVSSTPRSAMSLLELRVTLVTVAILVCLAAVAWILTVRQAADMSSMVLGLGQIGGRMPADIGAPIFLSMWLTMMVAMMFPTIAPIVLAHRAVVRKRGEGTLSNAIFVLGYLVVWTLFGLIPLAALIGFRALPIEAPSSWWLPRLAGAILIIAGLYQFTPLKHICLKACQNPLGFILQHDFSSGARGAFRAGTSHGAFCLGCCWALMTVLVVVGLMNLAWMAGIAVLFLVEKTWRHGVGLSRVVGTAVAVLGVAIILDPALLQTVSGGAALGGGGM